MNAFVATAALAAGAAAIPLKVEAKPDARLMELGGQLQALCHEERAHLKRSNAAYEVACEEACRRLGWEPYEGMPRDALKTWLELTYKIQEETGGDVLNEEHYAIWNRIDPLVDEVMKLPALTPAGLAIKACVGIMFFSPISDLWEEPFEDLDVDKRAIRNLFESVCAFAGKPFLPEQRAAP